MRKIILCLLFGLTLVGAKDSEEYQFVRVETGISFLSGYHIAGGFLVEPKINVKDNISIGTRFEVPLFNNFAMGRTPLIVLIKSEYFFSNKKIRPFAGVGTGIYFNFPDSPEVTEFAVKVPSYGEPHWGFMPQGGVNLGPIRLAIGGHFYITKTSEFTESGVVTSTVLRPHFISEISGRIGGRRK